MRVRHAPSREPAPALHSRAAQHELTAAFRWINRAQVDAPGSSPGVFRSWVVSPPVDLGARIAPWETLTLRGWGRRRHGGYE